MAAAKVQPAIQAAVPSLPSLLACLVLLCFFLYFALLLGLVKGLVGWLLHGLCKKKKKKRPIQTSTQSIKQIKSATARTKAICIPRPDTHARTLAVKLLLPTQPGESCIPLTVAVSRPRYPNSISGKMKQIRSGCAPTQPQQQQQQSQLLASFSLSLSFSKNKPARPPNPETQSDENWCMLSNVFRRVAYFRFGLVLVLLFFLHAATLHFFDFRQAWLVHDTQSCFGLAGNATHKTIYSVPRACVC